VYVAPASGIDFPIPLEPKATDQVGAVLGSFAVTDSGTAGYAIPIEVPPGRMGMEPKLGLVYSSTKAIRGRLDHTPRPHRS
jgi:hypothetical protein